MSLRGFVVFVGVSWLPCHWVWHVGSEWVSVPLCGSNFGGTHSLQKVKSIFGGRSEERRERWGRGVCSILTCNWCSAVYCSAPDHLVFVLLPHVEQDRAVRSHRSQPIQVDTSWRCRGCEWINILYITYWISTGNQGRTKLAPPFYTNRTGCEQWSRETNLKKEGGWRYKWRRKTLSKSYMEVR